MQSYFCLFLLCQFYSLAQTATITGIVLNEANTPLSGVNISSGAFGTATDDNGFYILTITADRETELTFSHLGHKEVILQGLLLSTNETFEFSPVLKIDVVQVAGVTVSPRGRKEVTGITSISPEQLRKIPGANEGLKIY